MQPYADATCVLKVNVHCEACKMKVVEVLSSIIGVYSVDVDAREGLAKVYGEVDPNILLKALARTGKHAELAWVKLKHPVLNRDGYEDDSAGSYDNYRNNYGFNKYSGSYEEPHGDSRYRRGLHGHPWYDTTSYHGQQQSYPMGRMNMADHQHPYYSQNHHGYGGYGPYGYMPSSRYMSPSSSYPPQMYPYVDDTANYCNVM